MNFKNHSLFILTTLIVFFPIGVVILIISDQPTKRKWILGAVGLLLFLSILSLSFLFPANKNKLDDFDIFVSRETLTIGQSGGLFLTNKAKYLTEYTITCDSDILSLNNNVYTAKRVGSARLIATANGITKSVCISVIEGESTLETVYASPSGSRYHKTASHAGKNAVEMTEEDALQSQKTPCLTCYKK